MAVRETLREHSGFAAIGAGIVLVVALIVIVIQFRGRSIPEVDGYWFDMDRGEVFTSALGQTPPIVAPSVGRGVRAQLFSCGACATDQWFGYLETMSEAFTQAQCEGALDRMNPIERQRFQQNQRMVRDLQGGPWMPLDSEQGRQLIAQMRSRCGVGEQRIQCEP